MSMRVIEISRPGGPEVLQLAERAIPEPAAGEVLIRVHAAGINRPDVFQRQGVYPPPPGASDLPGLEVAGEIVGGDVASGGWRLGDRVCALTAGGGYAEYCVAPASHCLPIPSGWTLVQAAGLPETAFTVWSNVFDRGRLAEGETLLVHGGASGIGVTAIQIATALGHEVYATVGSDARVAAVEKLGAARGINYRSEDFVEVIKQATEGRGVDVILDMVAGDYLPRNLKSLAEDGRAVVIALLGGPRGEVNAGLLMSRRLTLTGSTLRPRSIAYKAGIAAQLRERVWPLLDQGRIQPVVHEVFGFDQAVQAHALMESGGHIGKLVLDLQR